MSQLKRKNTQLKKKRKVTLRFILILLLALIAASLIVVLIITSNNGGLSPNVGTTPSAIPTIGESPASPEPTALPTPTPLPEFSAHSVESTKPSAFGFKSEINVDGENVETYTPPVPLYFGLGEDYSALDGVISFRGNNFRNTASFGTAQITEKTLSQLWNAPTGSLGKGESNNYKGAWTGSGWTGQPIIVRWPKETKMLMNMYDDAKLDDELVEVIYATMDGHVYFLNLDTGERTRDPLNLGVPFKGAGSLDPRGYPLLYLGQGDHYNQEGRKSRGLVVSLIDGKIIYEFGTKPDSFALRSWTAWDSSALVCAEADTLVYPGENGVLYIIKLNTNYDTAAGTISVNPSPVVKYRYHSTRTDNEGFWLGYEGSAAAYGHYLFLTENSGMMHCVDLNTMQTVWVQDIWDDTNCSPLFELASDGKGYLYIGNTLDNDADSNGEGQVAFFKIDASTGEVVWYIERTLSTTGSVTGGVMSCAILGQNNLDGLVFTSYASTGNTYSGTMVAYEKETGAEKWSTSLGAYSWTSPVAVYDESGNGYLVMCNTAGHVFLIDGTDGTILNTYDIESNIEASPAVFENTIVIGTRVQGIYGILIK